METNHFSQMAQQPEEGFGRAGGRPWAAVVDHALSPRRLPPLGLGLGWVELGRIGSVSLSDGRSIGRPGSYVLLRGRSVGSYSSPLYLHACRLGPVSNDNRCGGVFVRVGVCVTSLGGLWLGVSVTSIA